MVLWSLLLVLLSSLLTTGGDVGPPSVSGGGAADGGGEAPAPASDHWSTAAPPNFIVLNSSGKTYDERQDPWEATPEGSTDDPTDGRHSTLKHPLRRKLEDRWGASPVIEVVDGPQQRFLWWWVTPKDTTEGTTPASTTSNRPGSNSSSSPGPNTSITGPYTISPGPYTTSPSPYTTLYPSVVPECGLSGRIAGGVEANSGAWPWAVLLLNKSRLPYCGGVLISLRHALTAAHCLTGGKVVEGYPLWVTVGAHDLSSSEDHRRTVGVTRALYHAHFGRETKFDNDIGLLVLDESLDREVKVMPACLPHPDYSVDGSGVMVVGWGTTSEGGPLPGVLQQAQLSILPHRACRTAYHESFKPDRMICAGLAEGGADSCQGDSGGPLTQEHEGRWTVVGVVSHGRGCGRPDSPGVYTRVTTFVTWLTKVMALYP